MKLCYIGDARSIHLHRWIEHFGARDYEIHVISYHPADLRNGTLHHIRHNLNRWMQPVTFPAETLKITRIIQRIRPDIVHLFYVSIDGLAPALYKRQPLFAAPLGTDIRYDIVANPRFRPIIKYILHRADVILSLSNYLTSEIKPHLKKSIPIEPMPFGVDTHFFLPMPKAKNHTSQNVKVGFVKHLEAHYGPQILIQAIPQVLQKYPSTQFLFVGTGSLADALQKMVQELNIQSNVHFLGRLDRQAVKNFMQNLDVFAMPTVCRESFGVSALEAEAMQLPVVATNHGGIPEVVRDGESALLVAPENSEQLANALLKLIENPDLRLRMGKKGREYVRQHFKWSRWAQRMEELYQQYGKE